MHRQLIQEIVETKNDSIMKELEKILIDIIDDLKVTDHDEYKKVEYKLYKLVHGEHLDEYLARKWVHKMENKDGSLGEHWTFEQTSQYAGTHNKYDFYAIMNMIYSDYYNPKFDTSIYAEMTKDWLDDKDSKEGKALRYYMYVVDCR